MTGLVSGDPPVIPLEHSSEEDYAIRMPKPKN